MSSVESGASSSTSLRVARASSAIRDSKGARNPTYSGRGGATVLVVRDGFPASRFELKVEILAKIYATDFSIGAQRFGSAGAEDFPVIDDVGAVRDCQSLTDVVIGDQDTDPGVFQIEDDALQLQHLDRIDSGERLVEQQETRLDHKGAGDLDA